LFNVERVRGGGGERGRRGGKKLVFKVWGSCTTFLATIVVRGGGEEEIGKKLKKEGPNSLGRKKGQVLDLHFILEGAQVEEERKRDLGRKRELEVQRYR